MTEREVLRPTIEDVRAHFEAEHGHEWADWARLTMAERWRESARLWDTFLALGGGVGLHTVRRLGV